MAILSTSSAALLGEIAGPEVVPDLLVLASHENPGLMLHAHWGIRRWQAVSPRKPSTIFRAAATDAAVPVRCALAEQIGCCRIFPDARPRSSTCSRIFPGSPARMIPYLLMTTCYSLEQIGRTLQAGRRFSASSVCSRRTAGNGFAIAGAMALPPAAGAGSVGFDSRRRCHRPPVDGRPPRRSRRGWEDEDEDSDEPAVTESKPGRNDPCWCGSRKKYKKCHLDEDQEKERSGESSRCERRYTTALNRYSGEGILMSVAQATTPHNQQEAGGPAGLAQQCLYYMLLMREVEDRIERKLYRQGKVLGGVYVGRGQEAIPVGTALLADPET